MTDRAKLSAVAALAADLASEKGSEVAHTGAAAGEFPAGGFGADEDGQADLLREFEGEVEAFAGHAIAPPAAKRGPGRPPGSSRKTQQLVKWLRARGYRDPLEFLAAIYSADPKVLARDLGIEDVTDVLREQVKAAVQALPYVHQKLPMQVEHMAAEARPLFVLADIVGGKSAAEQRFMSAIDHVDIQDVTPPAAPSSHGQGSHGQAQGVEGEGETGDEAAV